MYVSVKYYIWFYHVAVTHTDILVCTWYSYLQIWLLDEIVDLERYFSRVCAFCLESRVGTHATVSYLEAKTCKSLCSILNCCNINYLHVSFSLKRHRQCVIHFSIHSTILEVIVKTFYKIHTIPYTKICCSDSFL